MNEFNYKICEKSKFVSGFGERKFGILKEGERDLNFYYGDNEEFDNFISGIDKDLLVADGEILFNEESHEFFISNSQTRTLPVSLFNIFKVKLEENFRNFKVKLNYPIDLDEVFFASTLYQQLLNQYLKKSNFEVLVNSDVLSQINISSSNNFSYIITGDLDSRLSLHLGNPKYLCSSILTQLPSKDLVNVVGGGRLTIKPGENISVDELSMKYHLAPKLVLEKILTHLGEQINVSKENINSPFKDVSLNYYWGSLPLFK